MTEFHRLPRFAPLDQIGVGLEDRVHFLPGGDRLSLQHPPAGLVHDPIGEFAVVLDLLAELLDHRGSQGIDPLHPPRIPGDSARVLHHLFGDAQQLAVGGLLLGVPLLGRHAFDRLHAAARAAGAIRKAPHAPGKLCVEILHQARDGAHRVPQQGGVGLSRLKARLKASCRGTRWLSKSAKVRKV